MEDHQVAFLEMPVIGDFLGGGDRGEGHVRIVAGHAVEAYIAIAALAQETDLGAHRIGDGVVFNADAVDVGHLHHMAQRRPAAGQGVERQAARGHGAVGEFFLEQRPSGRTHPGAQARIAGQAQDRGGQGRRVAGRHQQAGLLRRDDLGHAADIAADHRLALAHRLEEHQAEGFIPAGTHIDVALGIGAVQRLVIDLAVEAHLGGELAPGLAPFEGGTIGFLAGAGNAVVADDAEGQAGLLLQHQWNGVEQHVDALAMLQPPDEQDGRAFGPDGVRGLARIGQAQRRDHHLILGEAEIVRGLDIAANGAADRADGVGLLHQLAFEGQHRRAEALHPAAVLQQVRMTF